MESKYFRPLGKRYFRIDTQCLSNHSYERIDYYWADDEEQAIQLCIAGLAIEEDVEMEELAAELVIYEVSDITGTFEQECGCPAIRQQ